MFFSSVYFIKRLHIIIRKERKGNPQIVVLIIIERESEQNRVAGLLVMKEKDATFLIKSMISEVCSSPDLSVSKNLHKNLVMTEGEESLDSSVKVGLDA